MKTLKLSLAILALAGTASFAIAGPGPQFWVRPAAPKPAPAATAPAATVAAPAPVQTASAQPAACSCASGCAMMHR